MTSIDTLLARRGARLLGGGGNQVRARGRIKSSRFLAENFLTFDALRPHLLNPSLHPRVENMRRARCAIDYLRARGWIDSDGEDVWRIVDHGDVAAYLAGGWLEELVFCAYEAAGVDEVQFSQPVEWTVNDVIGYNEVDVIARRGDTLSFGSCKTLRAHWSGNGYMTQLRGHLTETDYWNIHFADDKGRALLVVTADFVDEQRHDAPRYPQLLARATILEVSLAGLEMLRWNRLVKTVGEHWSAG